MKKLLVALSFVAMLGAAPLPNVGVVCLKTCVETSKFGKSEYDKFDKMKKELETAMDVKEKELRELAPKFNEEYLESLTPEAEKELKERFQRLHTDLSEQQNRYYQTLQMAQSKIFHQLFELVEKASAEIAKEKNLSLIMNKDACLYSDAGNDISKDVIAKIDAVFEKEAATR